VARRTRDTSLFEDFAAGDFGANEMPHEGDAMQRGRVGTKEGIELFVGAFEISGEAQEFGEQAAGRNVGGVIANAFEAGGNGTLQITALNEFMKVRHGRSCCLNERRKSVIRSRG
jgi:hypothetical protein